MGNSLLRENRWQQDTQEMPWDLRLQTPKQRTSRCWDCHIADGCFCLPWKKIHIFKERQDSQKESEGMSSAPIQDSSDQIYVEELCYTLIDHSVLPRRPSGNSSEGYYENVSCKAESPGESSRGTETEYSLLHMPSTPRHPPSPDDVYELLMPPSVSSHFLQQPHLPGTPPESHFSHF
ncbi:germinal center-associated signaling and motility protein [Otolemur garnettii]|uniref:germinal center-associated signaling and motility protein n=1 Tax=Otolemur garnettii TaxID=30611 RepID=UPI0002741C77|nr:germinal center-associated signaling and motility protein [Otolemur garnettii]